MIITKAVLVSWHHSNKDYYEHKGYVFTNFKEKFEVSIKDLMSGSKIVIEYLCDYCKDEITEIQFKNYNRRKDISIVKKDSCKKCMYLKQKDSVMNKYGEDNVLKVKHIRDKVTNTNLGRYGVMFPMQSEDIRNKAAKTFELKYGNSFPLNSLEMQEKAKNTLKERYGVENVSQLDTTSEKIKQSSLKKYGVEHFTKTESYKKKLESIFMDKYGVSTPLLLPENRIKVKGENHWNWKGGSTPESIKIRNSVEYFQWRNEVFKRDNYTCQCCGDNKGGNLQAHHIDNFSEHIESRFDVSNGMTLCKNCHDPSIKGSFHNIYGTKNNNISQLNEYITTFTKNKGLTDTHHIVLN